MKRHINYTGRVRITRDQARVRILDEPLDGRPVFEINLRSIGQDGRYPDNALVRVESSRSNVVQRWAFGTIANPTVPTTRERRLTDVEASSFSRSSLLSLNREDSLALPTKFAPFSRLILLSRFKKMTALGWAVRFGGSTLAKIKDQCYS